MFRELDTEERAVAAAAAELTAAREEEETTSASGGAGGDCSAHYGGPASLGSFKSCLEASTTMSGAFGGESMVYRSLAVGPAMPVDISRNARGSLGVTRGGIDVAPVVPAIPITPSPYVKRTTGSLAEFLVPDDHGAVKTSQDGELPPPLALARTTIVCAGDLAVRGAAGLSRSSQIQEEFAQCSGAPELPTGPFPFARGTMWHLPQVPKAVATAYDATAPVAKGVNRAFLGLLCVLSDALSSAGAELAFDAEKCKFKGVTMLGGSPINFRAHLYHDSSDGGYSIELQKRSGDSLAWHRFYAEVCQSLPEECRPAAFAQGAPVRAALVAPPAPPLDDDESDDEEIARQPLLNLVESGDESVRREAVSAIARMACDESAASRFVEDGTLERLVELVNAGTTSVDAIVTATAAAAIANAARTVSVATAAAAGVVTTAIPQLLSLVADACQDSRANSDADLELMAMRRECGRALAELAEHKACAGEIGRSSGLGKLTQATFSSDAALVGFAQTAMARAVGAVC